MKKSEKHLDIMECAWGGRGIRNKTLHLTIKAKNLTRWAEDTIIFGTKPVLIIWDSLVDLKEFMLLIPEVPIAYAVSKKLTRTESSLRQKQ
jgi:hypothetical protein